MAAVSWAGCAQEHGVIDQIALPVKGHAIKGRCFWAIERTQRFKCCVGDLPLEDVHRAYLLLEYLDMSYIRKVGFGGSSQARSLLDLA